MARLMATTRVAEAKREYLKAKNAPKAESQKVNREAGALRAKLQKVVKARERGALSDAKRKMPAEIITLEEQQLLSEYRRALSLTNIRQAQQAPDSRQAKRYAQLGFEFVNPPAKQQALDFRQELEPSLPIKVSGSENPLRQSIEAHAPLPRTTALGKDRGRATAIGTDLPKKITQGEQPNALTADVVDDIERFGKEEALVLSPLEHARSLANLAPRGGAKSERTLQALGHSRESWERFIVERVAKSFHQHSLSKGIISVDGIQQCESLLKGIQAGDRRILALLAGHDAPKQSQPLREAGAHERSKELTERDDAHIQQDGAPGRRDRLEHQLEPTQERPRSDREALEHFHLPDR